jgi:hypothetical protein
MYKNGKMMPMKVFQEWGVVKENDGGSKLKYDIFYIL